MMRIQYIISLLWISIPLLCGDTTALKKRADVCFNEESFEEAIALYTECYATNNNDLQSLFNSALCLLKIGKFADAIFIFEKLIPRVQDPTTLKYNTAYAYKADGKLDTAINLLEMLIKEKPDHDDAHLALGFAYIQKGDFERGWKQHSRYLKKANKNGDTLRELLRTHALVGKKIVLHYEGGLGDTLLFIRYAERIKMLGAEVTCLVQKPLIKILERCPYIDHLQPYELPLPPYDALATLMSLPAIFEDTEDTFPVSIPYLYPDPALIKIWQKTIATYDGIKIGITWQSDVHNDVSRLPIARRGIPLTLFEPLLKDSRFTFFSLQCFEGIEQIKELSPDCRLITYQDFDLSHGAFMDTAALIANLDLVIAVDSAVANISGALGIPTLLLLPYVTDWRWIAGRTDSPWYPMHHIFKQPAPFDWLNVVTEVTAFLESYYNSKKELS